MDSLSDFPSRDSYHAHTSVFNVQPTQDHRPGQALAPKVPEVLHSTLQRCVVTISKKLYVRERVREIVASKTKTPYTKPGSRRMLSKYTEGPALTRERMWRPRQRAAHGAAIWPHFRQRSTTRRETSRVSATVLPLEYGAVKNVPHFWTLRWK